MRNKPYLSSSDIINTKFGVEVQIKEPVNIYGADIGNHVKIGPFVEIQKNVKIGSKTKIQSHTFICELVTIGESCFIGHGVMFINDLFKDGTVAGGDKNKWIPTLINDNVQIGSNSTILPVEIISNVVIGAGSVVTKTITKPGVYAGNPAKFIRGL